MDDKTKILDMKNEDIPKTVTVCCPLEGNNSVYLHDYCLECDHFLGVRIMVDAEEIEKKHPISGEVIGMRPLNWHERFMIVCAAPRTRRCSNVLSKEV